MSIDGCAHVQLHRFVLLEILVVRLIAIVRVEHDTFAPTVSEVNDSCRAITIAVRVIATSWSLGVGRRAWICRS